MCWLSVVLSSILFLSNAVLYTDLYARVRKLKRQPPINLIVRNNCDKCST